jgi:hypothetical protein
MGGVACRNLAANREPFSEHCKEGIAMSIKSKSLCVALSGFGLFVTNSAWAESATHTNVSENGDYSYRFTDEELLGDTLQNVGDMYRGRPKFARVLLLRPRTSLVNELLKSAEEL